MVAEATFFPDAETKSTARIPGNKGIWVGITCELVEFALMFTVYFVARFHYPDAFKAGPEKIWTTAGAINTVLMVTSSFFIACSVVAMRTGRSSRSRQWLIAAIVTALGYPVMKMYEVGWNLAHGIDGSAGIFYTVYYYLTFNHLVHACWGILGMCWVLARMSFGAYSAEQHDGLEALASYWHATDIVWLMIFPLFYVLA
ncbi:MAG TPA: cytochrome c oxidase subunit 3 family protein [Noviherbaspirillum sp.]|nr:cytochrome c oxidase subunit 3 family protein [Noviherbaspirillum sp.]